MNIVLFGGTFDPWTEAHQEITERLSVNFERVVVLPTDIRYYKHNHQFFSFEERLAGAREHTQGLENVRVLDLEHNIDDDWRFIDTLETVRRMYGLEHRYFVAIGSDSLQNFTRWSSWQKILECAKLIVFNRPGYTESFPDIPFEYLPMENPASSTSVRNALRAAGAPSFKRK